MAKVHMKRIEIITLITDAKSVVERLRCGVVDLIQYQPTDGADKFEKIDATQSISLLSGTRLLCNKRDVLNGMFRKNSLLSSFSPESALQPRNLQKWLIIPSQVCAKLMIISLDRQIDEHRVNLKSLYNAIEALESWRPLGCP